jgi:RNA polymerase sigma-70 factor (ECF subfamily)
MPAGDAMRDEYVGWVSAHTDELYRFARCMCGDASVAEDLVQDTFAEAWKCRDKLRDRGSARAWLFQILRYRYSHHVRRSKQEPNHHPLPDESDRHPPAAGPQTLAALADRDALWHGLNALSPVLRETFLMVFLQGLTCRETAAELKIPIGTVLSRLDAARRSLRKTLASEVDPVRPGRPAPPPRADAGAGETAENESNPTSSPADQRDRAAAASHPPHARPSHRASAAGGNHG